MLKSVLSSEVVSVSELWDAGGVLEVSPVSEQLQAPNANNAVNTANNAISFFFIFCSFFTAKMIING
jgi:hypothetical protein